MSLNLTRIQWKNKQSRISIAVRKQPLLPPSFKMTQKYKCTNQVVSKELSSIKDSSESESTIESVRGHLKKKTIKNLPESH